MKFCMIFYLNNSFVYKKEDGVLIKTPVDVVGLGDEILVKLNDGIKTSYVSKINAQIADEESYYFYKLLCSDDLFNNVITISNFNNKVHYAKIDETKLPTNKFLYQLGKEIAENANKNKIPDFLFDLVLKEKYDEIPCSFALGIINKYTINNEYFNFFTKAVKRNINCIHHIHESYLGKLRIFSGSKKFIPQKLKEERRQ